jgi:hypothetical protein
MLDIGLFKKDSKVSNDGPQETSKKPRGISKDMEGLQAVFHKTQ